MANKADAVDGVEKVDKGSLVNAKILLLPDNNFNTFGTVCILSRTARLVS